ncbi:Fms-interacting protein-domain-containing protein [Zopfochytrium polystomum]|nr:Fms-interacting protein-domain-containing protein [Zopfochytrium polystomum]
MFEQLRSAISTIAAAADAVSDGDPNSGAAAASNPLAALSPSQRSEFESLLDSVSVELLELQRLNRSAYLHARGAKNVAAEAKQEMDKMFLLLQNLNYERLHLRREVAKCRELETIYQLVELEPVEVFSASIASDELAAMNEHQLMVARLNREMTERKRLADEESSVRKQREELQKELDDKNAYLDKLDRDLEAAFSSFKPLQDQLGISEGGGGEGGGVGGNGVEVVQSENIKVAEGMAVDPPAVS